VVEEKRKVFLKVRGKGNKLNSIKTAYRIPVSEKGTSSKRKQSVLASPSMDGCHKTECKSKH